MILDIVVGERSAVFELLSPKKKSPPIRHARILDLPLHHVDGVARLHLEGPACPIIIAPGQDPDFDLHATARFVLARRGALTIQWSASVPSPSQ